ncbi:hypothetical protein THAOC_13587 [Thalassiosira oceanica]|uniref:Uncharacterized protein n=1 Tax=Thalassiosira oceanica TaxID=159749 RepID=K0SH84_THAOC|nr:hypothetical protein THAOC_13587 [Thalassiosira oceanica]|eukprot:EJK65538.1 hypothetical protein THAOC_13587 [Thalassiosira oceanica]
MGNLRGGEEAWKSLYKNVLDQNGTSVDLALMIMDDYNSTYPNSSLLERAKYIWTFPSYDNWIDAVDEVNGTSWRETHLPTFKDLAATNGPSILFGPLRVFDEEKNKTVQFAGSAMLIFMIRWFLIQKIHEQGILEKYDRFVVTRTDHFYACHHSFMSLDLSDGRIWLPVGQDFGGYTDRHMVVGGENLIDALDLMTDMILKPFDPSPHLAEAKAGRFGPHHNSESFLKHVWDSRNLTVSRLPRVMYVCAVSSDTSHFKIAKIPSEHAPGLLAKYQKEYDAARQCSNEMRPDPLEFCGHCQWQRTYLDCNESTMTRLRGKTSDLRCGLAPGVCRDYLTQDKGCDVANKVANSHQMTVCLYVDDHTQGCLLLEGPYVKLHRLRSGTSTNDGLRIREQFLRLSSTEVIDSTTEDSAGLHLLIGEPGDDTMLLNAVPQCRSRMRGFSAQPVSSAVLRPRHAVAPDELRPLEQPPQRVADPTLAHFRPGVEDVHHEPALVDTLGDPASEHGRQGQAQEVGKRLLPALQRRRRAVAPVVGLEPPVRRAVVRDPDEDRVGGLGREEPGQGRAAGGDIGGYLGVAGEPERPEQARVRFSRGGRGDRR